MKTYFDIIRDVSNLRWSILDPDPTSFTEVQKSVKLAIAQANSYIWSLEDFPFRVKKEALVLNKGQNAVLAPKGEISEVWIDGNTAYLNYIKSKEADFLSTQKEGKPVCCWGEFGENGSEIHIYPKPDKKMILMVRFITDQKAKDQNGILKNNLSQMDDVLNLPNDPVLEDLYLHCLNTKAMEYLIADTTDENYQPYQKEFTEAYRALLNYAGFKVEPRLTI